MRFMFTVSAFSLALPLAMQAESHAEEAAAAAPPPSAPEPEKPATPPVGTETPPPAAATVAPPAAPAAPTPPAVAFGWEALVDAYYLYNFTGDPKTEPPRFRQFDTTANNFSLNYAKLGVHADTDLVSFRMDIGAGHTAAVINTTSVGASGPGSPLTEPTAGGMYANFLVQQAFATVKPSPYVTIDAGKFVTSASAEVIESNKNWLYSRSLLFFGVPLLHTGLRVNVLPTPELTLMLEICNGWNNDPDINSDKTFGGNVTYVPANLGLTAGLTTYIGKEGVASDAGNTRMLFDGVVLKDIDKLSLGLNLDYFKVGSAYWFGASAMGRYIINDAFNVAARAEYLKSKNGAYLPLDGSAYEFTGMGAWTVGKHYELRAELRADLSDQKVFDKGGTARKNQVTGLLAALAYF